MRRQLTTPATPINFGRPEWLETEQDYKDAPSGTICAKDGYGPAIKIDTGTYYYTVDQHWYRTCDLAGTRRRILRWGRGNDD